MENFSWEVMLSLCLIKNIQQQCRHYFPKSVFISRRTNNCTQKSHNCLGKKKNLISLINLPAICILHSDAYVSSSESNQVQNNLHLPIVSYLVLLLTL